MSVHIIESKADGGGNGGGGATKDYISGFLPSRTSDTVLSVSSGVCRDDGDTFDLETEDASTINSAITGAGGLDTGSMSDDTWYYVWVVGKSDGTVAGLLSLSSTDPTMPSGYSYKRRVGSWRYQTAKFMENVHVLGKTNKRNFVQPITEIISNSSSTVWQNADFSSYAPPTSFALLAWLYSWDATVGVYRPGSGEDLSYFYGIAGGDGYSEIPVISGDISIDGKRVAGSGNWSIGCNGYTEYI
jgi:hypothetical protein